MAVLLPTKAYAIQYDDPAEVEIQVQFWSAVQSGALAGQACLAPLTQPPETGPCDHFRPSIERLGEVIPTFWACCPGAQGSEDVREMFLTLEQAAEFFEAYGEDETDLVRSFSANIVNQLRALEVRATRALDRFGSTEPADPEMSRDS
jgi:hypothetical protein